jgi:AraC family transcriptional regulator, regulatory protein of adaptative response / methylated-DNA-[protein]-cysteine methyltransferase
LFDAHRQIRDGAALDGVIFESGYESHSGFREAFARTFCETPGGVQTVRRPRLR